MAHLVNRLLSLLARGILGLSYETNETEGNHGGHNLDDYCGFVAFICGHFELDLIHFHHFFIIVKKLTYGTFFSMKYHV